MDAVYGTKRYLRSLIGNNSDIYGSPSSRITHNEINNSYGYRSGLHTSQMTKYPYFNDLSHPNQYSYNNWGIWREQSLAPSVYSTKSRNEVKSFSIILSTAAFIVILAVISVAGLAFYFGTFKSNLDEPVMMFEGNFHIMKGDVYTTALKYNHSSTYKQKVDFYERFVEKSLRDNNLQPVKVEILGFGDGPLINTIFRTFLDIRKIPMNIRSVEEHIREAILYQTNSPKSLYKSIRVDPDTISVKRVLDDEKIKSALFIMANTQDDTSNHMRKSKPSLIKSSPPTLITTSRSKIVKSTTSTTPEEPIKNEAEFIDSGVSSVPSNSFEGSFEITKTDADITRKKVVPTKSVALKKTPQTTVRLKSVKTRPTVEKVYKSPINTTLSMLVKPAVVINDGLKSGYSSSIPIPKTTTPVPKSSNKPTKIITTLRTRIVPTTTSKRTTTRSTTTITTPTTTTIPTTTTTTTTTETPVKPVQINNMSAIPYHVESLGIGTVEEESQNDSNNSKIVIAENREGFNPPRLDVHLFTTSPVLDTEPWRPIRPPIPTTSPLNVALSSSIPNLNKDELSKDFTGQLMNIKNRTGTSTTKDSDLMFYHSFTNPVFMPGLTGIEKLGNSVVKPHPIPVQLLDDIVVPDFRPVQHNDNILKQLLQKTADNRDLFEEIGGGVMFRKVNYTEKNKMPEFNITTTETSITKKPNNQDKKSNEQLTKTIVSNENTQVAKEKEENVVDLNNSENIQMEKKSEDIPLPNENSKINNTLLDATTVPVIDVENKKSKNHTVNIFNDTEGRNKQSSILASDSSHHQLKDISKTEILNSSLLFPSLTKWEYSNGTVENKTTPSSVRKIFNETLHAWVVRDGIEEDKKNIQLKNNMTTENRPKVNIQDISLIFDTLASKLGISTGTTYSRRPPFPASRLKQSSRIDSRTPTLFTPTTTPTTSTTPTTPTTPTATSTTSMPTDNIDHSSNNNRGFIPMLSSTENTQNIFESKEILNDSSMEKSEGEAEIEVIDPNIYDDILKYSQVLTSTSSERNVPTLMTLLPVKSNSGIRPLQHATQHHYGHQHSINEENFKSFTNTNFREATVRDKISVTN